MALSDMTKEELWQLFPIFLVAPRPEWAKWFAAEKSVLQPIFPSHSHISHVGSTSVPGIWAKDIVDILVEVPHSADFSAVTEALIAHGYRRMWEEKDRISFNKGYTEEGFVPPVFHLHLRRMSDCDELYFRDYLRDNPAVAREYEALKLGLWKQYEHDRDGYTEAKTAFIRHYTESAKSAYPHRYEPALAMTQKDEATAYAAAERIAAASEQRDEYFCYIDDFIPLLKHRNSYVRIRAFIVICSQSRWDEEGKLSSVLPSLLALFHDEKPTVVRQCLRAARELATFRPELRDRIREELTRLDLSVYRDSVEPLIARDIEALKEVPT